MMKSLFTLLLAIASICTVSAQNDVFNAARNGDVKSIETLHALNPDTINAKNNQGYTPVILACYYNQTAVLKKLIDLHVVLNEIENSPTALQAAAYKGFKNDVELLLDYGANPNIVDANGTSPLIYATQFGHQEIVKMLIKKGANVNYKDPNGFTALDYAKQLGLTELAALLSN